MEIKPFSPIDGATQSVSVSSSSQSVTIRGGTPGELYPVRIYNAGTADVWFRAGATGVVATTSNIPFPSKALEVLSFRVPADGPLVIAVIAAASTGTIYFTPGSGI